MVCSPCPTLHDIVARDLVDGPWPPRRYVAVLAVSSDVIAIFHYTGPSPKGCKIVRSSEILFAIFLEKSLARCSL